MTDTLSRTDRSALMARIRSKGTRPERIVRACLRRLGLKYRLHDADLPGRPDIVLDRLRIVVFVHGCFWHRHPRCRLAYTPGTRRAFWKRKFAGNVRRDRINMQRLRRQGWSVVVVWECQTRSDPVRLMKHLRSVASRRRGGNTGYDH
jgi:DNA mismatch endonuclease (patch repair protein)